MNSTEKMVLELHAAGKSIPDIAARIGRTESTVYMYLSRHGLNPSKRRKRPELGIGSWRIKQARNKARVGNRIRVKKRENSDARKREREAEQRAGSGSCDIHGKQVFLPGGAAEWHPGVHPVD